MCLYNNLSSAYRVIFLPSECGFETNRGLLLIRQLQLIFHSGIPTEQAPIQLGGPVVVVQIDESLFNHKPKVSVLLCNVVFIHIIKHSILWT